MAYVSAEERRAQAREVARRFLHEGGRYEDLSLRQVAKELGIPLSTLTYVYSSVSDLLDDFSWQMLATIPVEAGGLRVELGKYVRAVYLGFLGDHAARELLRHEATRLGSGRAQGRLERTLDLFTQIRRQAKENYRLPDDLMARVFRQHLDGALLHWIDAGAANSDQWYRDTMAAIDILVIAADPRPIGQPHEDPPFPIPDYDRIRPPRR